VTTGILKSTSPWAPLHNRVFRVMWIASVASNIGSWMHEVGAGWLMTSLAPSPLMVALVQAATTAPVFLLALPAGALADIVDRRRYLIAAQVWMLLIAAMLGVLTLAGLTTAPLLLVFTFALGIGNAMMMPAWGAITPELVPRDELQGAIGLNSMGLNVARAVGPALAGLIVAAVGPGAVFILNAVSFLAVIAALKHWQRPPTASGLPAERLAGAVRAGLRYARHSPELSAVLVRGIAFFMFASASWALLPLIVRQELQSGPGTFGLFLACLGLGAIVGALLLPRVHARTSRDRVVAGATVLYATAMLALAHSGNVYAAGAAMLFTGMAWISVVSSLMTAAQTALPAWVRARGLALFWVVYMGECAVGPDRLMDGHPARPDASCRRRAGRHCPDPVAPGGAARCRRSVALAVLAHADDGRGVRNRQGTGHGHGGIPDRSGPDRGIHASHAADQPDPAPGWRLHVGVVQQHRASRTYGGMLHDRILARAPASARTGHGCGPGRPGTNTGISSRQRTAPGDPSRRGQNLASHRLTTSHPNVCRGACARPLACRPDGGTPEAGKPTVPQFLYPITQIRTTRKKFLHILIRTIIVTSMPVHSGVNA